jgi:hypothetical protein
VHRSCFATAVIGAEQRNGVDGVAEALLPLVPGACNSVLLQLAAGSGDTELVLWVLQQRKGDSSGLVTSAASYGTVQRTPRPLTPAPRGVCCIAMLAWAQEEFGGKLL